jgi:DNA-binding transcriptional MocR family regulator
MTLVFLKIGVLLLDSSFVDAFFFVTKKTTVPAKLCNGGMQIAYPSGVEGFQTQLLKIQDNIPICASILSQHLALYSLEMGPEWVNDQVKDLVKNRDIILEALSPLGEGSVKGGEGAIYLWAKLPEQYVDDDKVVRWLAKVVRWIAGAVLLVQILWLIDVRLVYM